MDPNEKREEMVDEKITNTVNDQKCCVDCKTRRTPLWRSGPAGPKSLCNACGIRYRKKNKDEKGDLNRDEEIKEKLKDEKLESSSSSERRIKKIKLKDEKLESSSSSERKIKKIKLKDEKLESGSNERRIKKNKLKDDKLESSSKRRLKVSEDLRRRVMALGEEVVLLQRRPRSWAKRQKKRRKSCSGDHQNSWKKMGEVEQAAVLLMAMSCDSVFA